jgi:hypothetical protein
MADIRELTTGLDRRIRQRLTLDARWRFILLFALFDAMFCLLLLLSLHNAQLKKEKRWLVEDNYRLGNSLQVIEALATEAVERITVLESEIEELQTPKSTSVISTSKMTPTPTPPISAPTATAASTLVFPSPTATMTPTLVLPSPTRTPVPSAPTPNP